MDFPLILQVYIGPSVVALSAENVATALKFNNLEFVLAFDDFDGREDTEIRGEGDENAIASVIGEDAGLEIPLVAVVTDGGEVADLHAAVFLGESKESPGILDSFEDRSICHNF